MRKIKYSTAQLFLFINNTKIKNLMGLNSYGVRRKWKIDHIVGSIILLSIFHWSVGVIVSHDDPVVSLTSGYVRGSIQTSQNGRKFYSYRGIPYGTSQRFQPPTPALPWNDEFDGTQLGPICPQFNFLTRGVEGTEDCLVVNVYTSEKNDSDCRIPVMVFIHGGAFYMGTGSGELFGPGKFMDHDIVLVTFNYRLGILGYLNTGDDASCGNYGLLDQVLLLRWVQENVARFGGDPERVTIFGQSAGAASVVYHMLSPMSAGLFSGAIAQSGSAFCPWAYQVDPLSWAQQLGHRMDCEFIENTTRLVDCFRQKSTYELIRTGEYMKITQFTPHLTAPSAEKCRSPRFLGEDPIDLLLKGKIANKVPLIIGVTDDESYIFYKDWQKSMRYSGREFLERELQSEIGDLLPVDKKYLNAYEQIGRSYFNDVDADDLAVFDVTAIKFLNDALFNLCTAKTAEWLAKAGVPVKTYVYTHIGQHSFAETFGSDPGIYSSHADELYIQFAFFYAQIEQPEVRDKHMADILNTLWVQFAYGRNSTFQLNTQDSIDWPFYDWKSPGFLEMCLTPRMRNGTFWEREDLWKEHLALRERSVDVFGES